MTEDNCPKISEESMPTAASASKQRKRRKWDQPAESFISSGLAVPGFFPFNNMGSLAALTVPGVASLAGSLLTNPVPQNFQPPSGQQTTATLFQKTNPPKIQDELIAREIVINDAESTVRYKLTKRQTQEEIQRCTGAVVITRGKYRPPNALPDSQKPLYLHISAGSHLKETSERIIAVDHAAAMVEEMLKQGQSPNSMFTPLHSASNMVSQVFLQVSQPLSASVFLGFDTDPSLNIGSRIRGPNDQYINHIMNETGATVALRGRGSGNSENVDGEDLQQQLHLFLCCNNPKSLEDAKLLAQNLLDTIAAEYGASRISSSKIYKAVPPQAQLLDGLQSSGTDQIVKSAPVASVASLTAGPTLVAPVALAPLGYGQPQPNTVCYPQSSVCGTSYSGYRGIYPQATPLEQVALVLRHSPSPTTAELGLESAHTSSSAAAEKLPPQKRKFQELPVASKAPADPHQHSLQRWEFVKPGPPLGDSSLRTSSSMLPPPKKLAQAQPSFNGMPPPPPPPRSMPPPPSKPIDPPPSGPVPDTLFKLMEYGDDDDDDDDDDEEPEKSKSKQNTSGKPFWAL